MQKAQILRVMIYYQYAITAKWNFLPSSTPLSLMHGGGRVVSASGSETSVLSSTPTSAIIYDAYTSIINKKLKKKTLYFCKKKLSIYPNRHIPRTQTGKLPLDHQLFHILKRLAHFRKLHPLIKIITDSDINWSGDSCPSGLAFPNLSRYPCSVKSYFCYRAFRSLS